MVYEEKLNVAENYFHEQPRMDSGQQTEHTSREESLCGSGFR